MSHMIGKETTTKSSYDRYGSKHPDSVVTGQSFETISEKHLDVPKTKMVDAKDSKESRRAYPMAWRNRHKFAA